MWASVQERADGRWQTVTESGGTTPTCAMQMHNKCRGQRSAVLERDVIEDRRQDSGEVRWSSDSGAGEQRKRSTELMADG